MHIKSASTLFGSLVIVLQKPLSLKHITLNFDNPFLDCAYVHTFVAVPNKLDCVDFIVCRPIYESCFQNLKAIV